jgi:calnexin
LIVQYEVRFQNKHECGGAYIKLLADKPDLKLEDFTDKTEYTIMFGPDRCGNDNKLHFIFQHENPITNKMEEKHAKKPKADFGNIFDDGKTHLITLVVKPDNTYNVLVDRKELSSGSLLKDMEPPVNPPKMVDDTEDKKPDDWDEREKIQDPDATKPDDWDEDAPMTIEDQSATKPSGWLDDESDLIPDPAAVRPEDWDDEEDGEWEAPQIDNPKCKAVGCGEWKRPTIKNPNYKGKWSQPLIPNPAYKGIWAPRKIENPSFFEDTNPFAMKSIAAVGFELWSMQSDILFDNLIISDDQGIVDQWTVQTWEMKRKEEKSSDSSMSGLFENFKDAAEEKPWLWIVAVACLFVPIVLIIYFCTGSSKTDEAGRRKKTDEPQADDEVEGDEENDDGGEAEGEASGKNTEDEEADGESEDKPKIEEIVDDKEESKKEETEEANSENVAKASEERADEDEAGADEGAEVNTSPRSRSKRKVRKD